MKTLLFILAISFSMTCAFGAIQAQSALKIRAAPTSQAPAIGLLALGTTFEIECQATGEEITNGASKTNLWYYISSRTGYVSAAFVATAGKPFPVCTKASVAAPALYNCAGLQTTRSCADAVAWAESKLSTVPSEEYSRKADRFVANAHGKARSGFETPLAHLEATPEEHKHTDRNPPAGALVYFKTGTSSYVALSTGNGALIGTDIGGVGTITRTSIAGVETKWRGVYLGWTAPFFK